MREAQISMAATPCQVRRKARVTILLNRSRLLREAQILMAATPCQVRRKARVTIPLNNAMKQLLGKIPVVYTVERNGGNHGKETYSINDFRWLWIK